MTDNVRAIITKKSLATLLREAGAPGEYGYSRTAGAMRFIMTDGTEITPGEAAERFLSPCGTCGQVWPRCPHI